MSCDLCHTFSGKKVELSLHRTPNIFNTILTVLCNNLGADVAEIAWRYSARSNTTLEEITSEKKGAGQAFT